MRSRIWFLFLPLECLFDGLKVAFNHGSEGEVVNDKIVGCVDALKNHFCHGIRAHVVGSVGGSEIAIGSTRGNSGHFYVCRLCLFSKAVGEAL